MTDAAAQLQEQATFCKTNDPKRPGQVGLPDATIQQICPADGSAASEVASAYPDGWYVRVMFDELLDPSIETLTEIPDGDGMPSGTFEGSIAASHPVTVQCQSATGSALVNVDYDGYYSPAGNNVTWPLGPSLVIKPTNPKAVATGHECQITINDNVTDKDGNPVPAEQRGPFKFKVAPISVVAIDPADDPMGEGPIDAVQMWYDNAYVQFNTYVDPDTVCPDDDGNGLCDSESVFAFKDTAHATEGPGLCNTSGDTCGQLTDCPNGNTVCGRGICTDGATICNKDADCATGEVCSTAYAYSLAPYGLTDAEFGFGPAFPLQTKRSYTFGFTAGAKLKDRCGVETAITSAAGDMTLSTFSTNEFKYRKATIATGETSSAMKKLMLSFSNVLQGAEGAGAAISATGAITSTDWTLEPMPFAADGTTQLTQAQVLVSDPGASGQAFFAGYFKTATDYTFTLKAGAKVHDWYGAEYTNASELKITWKTAASITATTSPADNATVTKATPTSPVGVTITFNAAMKSSTLDAADYTFVDANGAAVAGLTVGVGAAPNGCGAGSTGCQLRIRGVLAPGKYKFTLKAGAEISDVFGAKYTQAADKVINFEVKEAEVVPAIQCL